MTQNKVIGTHRKHLTACSRKLNRLGREQAQSSVEKNEYLLIFHRLMTFISRWSSSPFFCPSLWPIRIYAGQMDTSWKRTNTLEGTNKSYTCRPSLKPVTFCTTRTRNRRSDLPSHNLAQIQVNFCCHVTQHFKIIQAQSFSGKTKLLVSFETKP